MIATPFVSSLFKCTTTGINFVHNNIPAAINMVSSLPLVIHHLSEVEHLEPQQKLLASMGTLKNSNTGAYRLSRS